MNEELTPLYLPYSLSNQNISRFSNFNFTPYISWQLFQSISSKVTKSDLLRSLKGNHLQVFREKNRDQMVESSGEVLEETGLFRKRSNISEEIGNGGQKSYDLMDVDYRLYLEFIGAFLEGDLMETGDREEDVGAAVSEDLVDSSPNEAVNVEGAVSKELTDSSPNEVMVDNVEGAVSKDSADSSTNEVVVVENVELNENKNENEMVLLDEECPDPHYKIFLDNVKEDGKFYVFENVREDGAIETFLYEREDEDVGEFMDVEAAELVTMSFAENLKEVDTTR